MSEIKTCVLTTTVLQPDLVEKLRAIEAEILYQVDPSFDKIRGHYYRIGLNPPMVLDPYYSSSLTYHQIALQIRRIPEAEESEIEIKIIGGEVLPRIIIYETARDILIDLGLSLSSEAKLPKNYKKKFGEVGGYEEFRRKTLQQDISEKGFRQSFIDDFETALGPRNNDDLLDLMVNYLKSFRHAASTR